MSTRGWLRKLLFDISQREASAVRRGFRSSSAQLQLEQVGRTFLRGYSTALETDDSAALERGLGQIDAELRGFAFEGAAMTLALFDLITPWRRDRLAMFLKGAGDAHAYMVHVGIGWAVARVPWARSKVELHLQQLDPLLRWLVLDGYGFHQGYFHWAEHVRQQKAITRLSPYARRAFDQGLGRSLWFVEGADIPQIMATILAFDDGRRADLWSGVGLACAYAGCVQPADVEALREAAPQHLPEIAQGAAFAAKARQRAGNEADHTDFACRILASLPASSAAAITDECLDGLPDGSDDQPAYELWRRRVQERLMTAGARSEAARPSKEEVVP